MNAAFAPERRVYAANGGPSHSRFATDFLNRMEQHESNQRASAANLAIQRRGRGRFSDQIAHEQLLPPSLNVWYISEISSTGEFFLVNLENDWKKVHNQFVSLRRNYVANLHNANDDERKGQVRRAYIDELWKLMAPFYNENRDVISRLRRAIHILWRRHFS